MTAHTADAIVVAIAEALGTDLATLDLDEARVVGEAAIAAYELDPPEWLRELVKAASAVAEYETDKALGDVPLLVRIAAGVAT